jgi:hypothetical protein
MNFRVKLFLLRVKNYVINLLIYQAPKRADDEGLDFGKKSPVYLFSSHGQNLLWGSKLLGKKLKEQKIWPYDCDCE